ncbi:LysR family transcriptional regulator [Pacificibacter marinus]|uniref:LysR family transcriptional regulator n=1 Tax=Pacificibacter marinus TaxID=658057 RepID=UPI0025AF984A|nr:MULTISPECIES: LysR family transcriptional regulator [Pacificibacter]MDO6616612.1 LysR family transcriptional regulator [Pacificibacter sp. 1_MG-2023]
MTSKIDLRHLRVLQALLHESNVSRAAVKLGLSQPAISATLRQLRDTFNDPLLVRSGAAMVRTERANDISMAVDRVLTDIDLLLSPPGEFDPATSDRTIRIVAYFGLGSLLIPSLIQTINTASPKARIEIIQPGTPDQIKQQLHDGDIDLVISSRQDPYPNLRFAPLVESDIACVVANSHEKAGQNHLTLDEYLTLDHISPSAAAVVAGTPIDGQLLQLGKSRNVVATVPEFALARQIVPQSNLVLTTARPFAEEMAATLSVTVLEAPPELGLMSAWLFWHEKSHHSPFGHWLRQTVRHVAQKTLRMPS